MNKPVRPVEASPAQRSSARRTALLLGAIAATVYAVFILSGVIGR